MSTNLGTTCKKCRRAGEKLLLKGDRCLSPKCAVVRKPYQPGVHGKASRRGLSEYGQQLRDKQDMRKIYGVSERQFRKHIEEARSRKGVWGDNIISRLELRMDNIVYRLGFAISRAQARQLVSHSMFLVNGRVLNVASAELKIGDEVSVKPHKMQKEYFKAIQPVLKKSQQVPGWLSIDPEAMKGKILSKPNKDEMGYQLNTQGVIEYYSR